MKPEIAELHFITQDIDGKPHAELAERLCKAGVRWVQLRIKDKTYEECVREAHEVKKVCLRHGAVFIVNDNVYLAKEVGADGVHLGAEDMDTAEARLILGEDAIIGGTANSLNQASLLLKKHVDYIGLGPLRFTRTKKSLKPILGFEGVAAVMDELQRAKAQVPVIVIGGVTPQDVKKIKELGAHGVAVSSALAHAKDPVSVVKEFLHHE